MSLSRVKTWIAGEVLTASDLNAEFNSILNNPIDLWSPAAKAADMNGFELILDADADTSITADTDDQIDFRLGGSDTAILRTTGFSIVGGHLNFGSRSQQTGTDRIVVTSATTIFSLALTASSVGIPSARLLVNGYRTAAPTTDVFSELVMFISGTTPVVVTGSTVSVGAPGARTYSASGGNAQLAMAGSVSYTVSVTAIEQAN